VFEGITGQEGAKKALRMMVESERIPHTLLFAGPYGVGKGETALELARMLLCENGADSDCRTCGSCLRASRLEHPDLHILFPFRARPSRPDKYSSWLNGFIEHRRLLAGEPYAPVVYGKGRQIVVEHVMEVREKLLESSFEGGRKVCVILGAEYLNDKTANTLLKILEEPPAGVHFILTAERLSSVLPTIVSRASVVRFRRLTAGEVERYLEGMGIDDPEKRRFFADSADGSIKTAKAHAFSGLSDVYSGAYRLFAAVAEGGYEDVVSGALPFLWSRDFPAGEELVHGFIRFLKEVLEAKFGREPRLGEYNETVGKLSRVVDTASLHRLAVGFERALDMLRRNVNISLVIADILYEINDVFGKKRFEQRSCGV